MYKLYIYVLNSNVSLIIHVYSNGWGERKYTNVSSIIKAIFSTIVSIWVLLSHCSIIGLLSTHHWISIYYDTPMVMNAHRLMMSYVMSLHPLQKKPFLVHGLGAITCSFLFHTSNIQMTHLHSSFQGWHLYFHKHSHC